MPRLRRKVEYVYTDPAYPVPVRVYGYVAPADSGWTRQTHRQAVAAYSNQKQRQRRGDSLYTPRRVDVNDREHERERRWNTLLAQHFDAVHNGFT